MIPFTRMGWPPVRVVGFPIINVKRQCEKNNTLESVYNSLTVDIIRSGENARVSENIQLSA
jgi:hypothetical protein